MPILGLVLVLDDDANETRLRVGEALGPRPGLELGEVNAHRWPAVLEAASECAAEIEIDALRSVPGIAGVDLVYANFEDLLGASASESLARE
jgi:hypothetical protein